LPNFVPGTGELTLHSLRRDIPPRRRPSSAAKASDERFFWTITGLDAKRIQAELMRNERNAPARAGTLGAPSPVVVFVDTIDPDAPEANH
jgi:hypothetical protein